MPRFTFLLAALLFACLRVGPVALAAEPLVVTAEALRTPDGLTLGAVGWRYHAGDDPAWAAADLDDAGWEAVDSTSLRADKSPASGWPGVGWWRLHFDVEPALVGRPIALQMLHFGASEIFVDGELLATDGAVSADTTVERGHSSRAIPVVFATGAGPHVLAVRYSNARTAGDSLLGRALGHAGIGFGFQASLGEANTTISSYADGALDTLLVVLPLGGLLLTSAILHLLLYMLYRERNANLYYALFAFGFAATLAGGFLPALGHWNSVEMLAGRTLNRFGLLIVFTCFVRFLYAAFDFAVPRRYAWLVAAWGAAFLWAVVPFTRSTAIVPLLVCISLSISEAIVTIMKALRLRVDGARIIGAGVLAFAAGLTASLLNEVVFQLNSAAVVLASVLGFVVFPMSVSLYLARSVARTSRDLSNKLVEVETLSTRAIEQERREAGILVEREQEKARAQGLEYRAAAAELQARAAQAQALAAEADHQRRTKELDEARALQLSMLPKSAPTIPGLEVAAFMRTATEVGGDYYDFHAAEDGSLTIAVGDATGHGLKAGTLVAAVKGLFGALAGRPDLREVLGESSRAIKRMRLGQLYMALTLARFTGGVMTITSAGMPFPLVYRAATGEVEQLPLKGMWLGAVVRYVYEQIVVTLEPGDVVLLMSDGFPEMFDERRDMLGYERAAEIFRACATVEPAEIIDRLRVAGEQWAGARPQDDDVTFVVVRVGSGAWR